MNKYRQLRKEKRMSQANLAELLGVSQTAVSQWETNKNYPDINTIKELAEIFSVTTDYLLNVDSNKLRRDNEIVIYNSIPAGVVDWANIHDRYGFEEIGAKYLETGKEFVGFHISDGRYEPVFIEDDILIIEVRDDCDSGDIALVQANFKEGELKKVIYKNNGILTQPISYSDSEGDFYVTNSRDRLNILGVVREVRRTMKNDSKENN